MPAGREGPTGAAARVTSSPCRTPALPVVPTHPLNKAVLLLCAARLPAPPRAHSRRKAALVSCSRRGKRQRARTMEGGHQRGPMGVCTAAPLGGIKGQKSVPSVWRGLISCCLRGHTPSTGSKGGSSWPLPAPGTPWLAAVSAPALRRPHVALGVCALTHVSCRDSGRGTRSS